MRVRLLGLALLATGSALAGEFAVLSTGFRIQAERHEAAGDMVKLYLKDGGVTQLHVSQIASFEPDDSVVPEPPSAPAPETAIPIDPRQAIERAAERWGLPAQLIHSVARAESAYNPAAISPKGAIGVMQLMPGTARELGANPHDLEQNVDAGTRYLRDLLLKYGNSLNKALAAYNAGPGAVDRYQAIPPYRETVKYVDRVIRDYRKQER